MGSQVCVVVMCCSLSLAVGCGSQETGPAKYPVTGTVSWQGELLESGTIFFVPKSSGGNGASLAIQNGTFGQLQGPGLLSAGSYRVEITSPQKTGKKIPGPGPGGQVEEVVQVIPARYNSQSTLEAVVGETDANQYDFDLRGN